MDQPLILIIDKDPYSLDKLGGILRRMGMKFLTAETSAEGISSIKNHAVDLALVDLGLADVYDTVSQIKVMSPLTAILILTGKNTIESALEATRRGAFSYLVKPFDEELVAFKIRWAIEKGKVETRYRESEAKFSKLLQAAPDGILIVNEKQEIVLVNDKFEEMFGYLRSEIIGKDLKMLIPSRFSHHREYAEEYILKPQKRFMGHGKRLFALRKDGSEFSVEIGLSHLETAEGLMIIAIIRDITYRISLEVQLEHRASHDDLTKLANRNLLGDRLDQALVIAERYHQNVAVLFVNLDNFKIINNSLGHDAGDRVLMEVADRFSSCVGARDTLARYGGDDFVFVLHDVFEKEDIAMLAQKILSGVSQPIELDDHTLDITCSIGISVYPKDGKDSQTLLKNADAAMSRAKETGRNTYCFFTPRLNDRAVTRMNMERHLRRALVNRELSLRYQPQVSLASGRMIGAEALLRWENPELGVVSPTEFIPLAEETGLIIPLCRWVLWTACSQSRHWQKLGLPPFTTAVNLSPRQFWNPDLLDSIAEILRNTRLDPACLELEITESMVMRDRVSALAMLNKMKGTGVKLAIDDFGTGYSNLSYLSSFPFDKLKMDISFVREITSDPGSSAIARTIISLAHNLDLKVIAEGVENEPQLSYLRHHGCDEIQGYFFSKPVSAQEFTQLLREERQIPAPRDLQNLPLKTLLILDDEQRVIDFMKRVLYSENYRVISATSPSEGFNQLALNRVDVILCDQNLPEMSGVEFLKRVRSLYPETIRIAMSGHADADMIANSINQSGIYKFLIKPVDKELLIDTVNQAFMVKGSLSL